MDLLCHRTHAVALIGKAERLHEVPAGKIRHAHIAHLAAALQLIERLERLLERCLPIPFVQLVQVDIIGLEPRERCFAGAHQVMAGGTAIVGPLPHRKARLGGDQHVVTARTDGLTQDLFGHAARIDIGRVEQIDAGLDASIHLAAGTGQIGIAGLGEEALATECHGARA